MMRSLLSMRNTQFRMGGGVKWRLNGVFYIVAGAVMPKILPMEWATVIITVMGAST